MVGYTKGRAVVVTGGSELVRVGVIELVVVVAYVLLEGYCPSRLWLGRRVVWVSGWLVGCLREVSGRYRVWVRV